MRGDEPAIEEADGVEELDRRHGVFFAQQRHLLGHLGEVDEDGQIQFGRECGDQPQMLDIDGVGRVRRDGRRDQRIAAPGGGEFFGEREAAVGLGRVGRGKVNHGLAEHGAHAGFFHDGGEFLLEVVAVHHRGDAALDHFDDAVESAPVNELAVHEIFLERENESPQPVRHIVAEAAEDGHRGVRMGVDHTGEHEVAAGIDGFEGGELRGERGRAHGDNA